MTRHQASVDVHDLDKLVLALDVQPLHRGPVSDLAFLQLLQHIGQRASFETFARRPKLLLNQVERSFLSRSANLSAKLASANVISHVCSARYDR